MLETECPACLLSVRTRCQRLCKVERLALQTEVWKSNVKVGTVVFWPSTLRVKNVHSLKTAPQSG